MCKKIIFISTLLLVTLVLSGAACGKKETGEGGAVPSGGIGGTSKAPTSDVAGQDISDIPRYTGSVRIFHGSVPGVTDSRTVVYLTSASIDTVSDFYEAQLPANGWVSPIDEEMMREFG